MDDFQFSRSSSFSLATPFSSPGSTITTSSSMELLSSNTSTCLYSKFSPTQASETQDRSCFELVFTSPTNLDASVAVSVPVEDLLERHLLIQIRDAFAKHLAAQGQSLIDQEAVAAQVSTSLLVARLLLYLSECMPSTEQPQHQAHVRLLEAAWARFDSDTLSATDVHTFARQFSSETASFLLRAYYEACAALEGAQVPTMTRLPALFRQAQQQQAGLYALFGGQGNNLGYFAELQMLFNTYRPFVEPIVTSVQTRLCHLIARIESSRSGPYPFHSQGLDLLAWLKGESDLPSEAYLASVPISAPLLSLTQMLQFYVSAKCIGMSVPQFRSHFQAVSGHSQGIVSATAMALATDDDHYAECVVSAAEFLFQIGLNSQLCYGDRGVCDKTMQESSDAGFGAPSPMLVVSGPDRAFIDYRVAGFNRVVSADRHLYVALANTPTTFVLAGHSVDLLSFARDLSVIAASANHDQARVPYSKRRPVIRSKFLPINLPYHSPLLAGVHYDDVVRPINSDKWQVQLLALPVHSTTDGSNLQLLAPGSLLPNLCAQMCTEPVDWINAVSPLPSTTHLIDFGTGGAYGIGNVTARNLRGRGINVLTVSGTHKESAHLYRYDPSPSVEPWETRYQPRLLRTPGGRVMLDTPMSRLLGKAPIMIAGMTPTTVHASLNVATMQAGYHIELAGGGLHDESKLRACVHEIVDQAPGASGLTLNSLYLNPRQWSFQLPAWLQLSREGLPIDGLCVAAGIPSPDIAQELLVSLQQAGLRHVSFKPGSLNGINQVCKIAQQNPTFPIMLQWTGGRAGGHHSAEDFHDPIVQSYHLIRACPNLILVAGSGFTSAESFWPYLSGQWSVERNLPPMPFDGVLFGSWAMTAKEAATSLPVKHLISSTQGCTDQNWQQTYDQPVGGIVTVLSEMGELVHQVANRATLLWFELDRDLFKLSKDQQTTYLSKNKIQLIKRLNDDFQRVWFPSDSNGTVLYDVSDMTYSQVALRMLSLMFVAKQARWIHLGYRNLLGDWCRRIEERFSTSTKSSRLQSYTQLDSSPGQELMRLFDHYPDCKTTLLTGEDVEYFHNLCWRRGQKPPPFITRLGDDFAHQFKKDSLWQSEDLHAVVDADPQRVCILHGPVSASNTAPVDQPVGEMLRGVEESLVQRVLDRFYDGDTSNVPVAEYLDAAVSVTDTCTSQTTRYIPQLSPSPSQTTTQESVAIYQVDSSALDDCAAFLDVVIGERPSWLRALLRTPRVRLGQRVRSNPIQRLLTLHKGQLFHVHSSAHGIERLQVYGCHRSYGTPSTDFLAVDIFCRPESAGDQSVIEVTLFEECRGESIPLSLQFLYTPDRGNDLIQEVEHGRNDRIRRFYWKLWFGEEMPDAGSVIEARNFSTGLRSVKPTQVQDGGAVVVDTTILVAWEAIMKTVVSSCDADLLSLVHLGHEFRVLPGMRSISPDDLCSVTARASSIVNSDTGKILTVKATISRSETTGDDALPIVEATSRFFFKGRYADHHLSFSEDNFAFSLLLEDETAGRVLKSKDWITLDQPATHVQAGRTLVFRGKSVVPRFGTGRELLDLHVEGIVYAQVGREEIQIGSIEFDADGPLSADPVVAYLERSGRKLSDTNDVMPMLNIYKLAEGKITTPKTNEPYSRASTDFNPIHVNPYFAQLAGLPTTIGHGMSTFAECRKWMDIAVTGEGSALAPSTRCTAFNVDFTSMVSPGDQLVLELRHKGMSDGQMVLQVDVSNESGALVLQGTARYQQPRCVYVFTGQGSQFKGMGMDLYQQSATVRAIWDEAEMHLAERFGLSILEIVRDNPPTKTVYFGGAQGQKIRNNYMSLQHETMDDQSRLIRTPIFPSIHASSRSYTFESPKGLLFATQFTQIALVLFELSYYRYLQDQGVIVKDAVFAGHSLGEYAALASVGGMMRLRDLVDVVFYRGLAMQSAVPRVKGRSEYGMVAVSPFKAFPRASDADAALEKIVESISEASGELLQVVNYNVAKQQSVVAGHEVALAALSTVLDKTGSKSLPYKDEAQVAAEVRSAVEQAQGASEIQLKRGTTTIPLAGIDVPFHSRFLSNGIGPFRRFLSSRLNIETVESEALVGRYIPNLVARPFSLERSYIEHVAAVTESEVLACVLSDWEQARQDRPRLARSLVIELLAYQFASPVRWSQTQAVLFRDVNFERLVEFGPTPTLVGMASKTLAADFAESDRMFGISRSLLCVGKDDADIIYNFGTDEVESVQAPTHTSEESKVEPVVATPAVMTVIAPETTSPALEDERLDALLTLRAILAQKQKVNIGDIPSSRSIKQLTGGRSTLQNELIGDLSAEFAELPERAEELTLEELAAALRPTYSGELGKYTNNLVARLVSGKLPGTFGLSAVKSHLASRYGFQNGRISALLLYTVTNEPAKRLAGDQDAITWIDGVAAAYAKDRLITLPSAERAAAGSGAMSSPQGLISSKELMTLQTKMLALSKSQLRVLSEHVGLDSDNNIKESVALRAEAESLRSALDVLAAEHGDIYVKGIQGIFTGAKARNFKSYWNWSRQNLEELFADILRDQVGNGRDLHARIMSVWYQLDDATILEQQMQQWIESRTPGSEKLLPLFQPLLAKAKYGALREPPRCTDLSRAVRPKTFLDSRGNIVYHEVPREGMHNMLDYVKSMAIGEHLAANQGNALAVDPIESFAQRQRTDDADTQALDIRPGSWLWAGKKLDGGIWAKDDRMTEIYYRGLARLAVHGSSYAGFDVLLTGVGQGSIGFEVMRRFLKGGARVIVTTSTFSPKKLKVYQDAYRRDGARGSQLTVLPFNQASHKDTKALVDYIYTVMGMDLDVLVPFAAISENGRYIDGIDDKSELAHRIMLTNVIRLLGCIKTAKAQRKFLHRPTQALLPLSFNHGVLGGDGLYGASKIGLETLLSSYESEDWSQYISVAGARIGMCRGTDLMATSDIVAESLEAQFGCRTFSTSEMAFNLMGIVESEFALLNQTQPVFLDLTGRAASIQAPGQAMREAHRKWQLEADIKKALLSENRVRFTAESPHWVTESHYRRVEIEARSMHRFAYPTLDPQEVSKRIAKTDGPIDLDQVIVISGFAEVGPWGSSRTRWEREMGEAWSLEGLVEMAWLMGYIKHFNGRLADGRSYIGWVDTKTGEAVVEGQIRARYAPLMEQHAGIRVVEPELMHGFDPDRKVLHQGIELTHDLEPLEVSAAEAERFRLAHGERATIWQDDDTKTWYVRLKKGASIFVPKASRFDRHVAGQLPTGWDPTRYGIPNDIVSQTDETALYALVCIAEALVQSGIDDPYELYQHVHVSEVGTSLGSAMGGLHSLAKMFKDRRQDVEVQKDILQETFINTVAGWTNLLLLSSSGPIKPTVGACATALQSLDVAAETIRCGKAKIMIAGGYESISEESMTEFANMEATASSDAAFAAGLAPEEISKPMTSGRSGFVESQGCGVQIVMSAATAIKIGAPINGILAFTQTATDRQGRSIPAPGRGVLAATVPLQRAMNSWGLDGNDVGVVSMHGTSTKANDKNESNVYHTMLGKLGRAEGRAVPAMAQKWLCGHGKGGAAAWAVNGLMQCLNDGIVAGNRNADDIADELRGYDRLSYPCRSIQYPRERLHAGLITSFGFGQVGGIAMLLHASHLLDRLDYEARAAYADRREKRQQITYRRMHSLFVNGDLVRIKDDAPYTAADEMEVLLDVGARAALSKEGIYRIVPSDQS